MACSVKIPFVCVLIIYLAGWTPPLAQCKNRLLFHTNFDSPTEWGSLSEKYRCNSIQKLTGFIARLSPSVKSGCYSIQLLCGKLRCPESALFGFLLLSEPKKKSGVGTSASLLRFALAYRYPWIPMDTGTGRGIGYPYIHALLDWHWHWH